MEPIRLKPGKCYKVSSNTAWRVLCGVFLRHSNEAAWIVEAKVSLKTRAKTGCTVQSIKQEPYKVEVMSLDDWDRF